MITKPRSEANGRARPAAEPKKYRRRRCQLKTCNRLYPPVRPNQRFCSKEHKDEFHFKTESYQRTKGEVIKLVSLEVDRHVERIARAVFLRLETAPPPALVDRVVARLADMIHAGTLRASKLPIPTDPRA